LLTHRRIKEVSIASEFSNWKDDYTEFHLVFDRDRLSKYGITATQLFAAIEPTFGREINCGQIVIDRSSQRINLYSRQSDAYDIFTLMRQPFDIGDKTFKLSDIGSIEKRQASKDIIKKNQEYVMCLQYEYIGSNIQGEKVLNRDLETINSIMPVGYKAESERQQWKAKDESGKYRLLLLVIAIIFFTTAILFNSLRQPFAIIFIIPVSFIGVFSVFYLFKLNFDQGGFASFILLAGITVNAAIYILNEYNSLRTIYPNVAPIKIYLRAFRIKIIPIILTVMSTILGFIPFIIGERKESLWYPLAIGTMGDLTLSILALLFILPILILQRSHIKKAH
ncbi:MAG: efflux RND transporter permease subunit, partial [Duncaniella sp.]|nr:efflux RND transporter permease subunit [Duncaniella sp.]